jgi:hypothetical protein
VRQWNVMGGFEVGLASLRAIGNRAMDQERSSAIRGLMECLSRRRTRGLAIGITMEGRHTSPVRAEGYIRNVALIMQTSVDDIASRIVRSHNK